MHLSDNEAAQRVADNDNLVGDLIKALEYYTDAVREGDTCGGGYYSVEDDGAVARNAIAKAKAILGAQQ